MVTAVNASDVCYVYSKNSRLRLYELWHNAYYRSKFIASRPLSKSAQRWLNIVAIGLHQSTRSAMARGLMKSDKG